MRAFLGLSILMWTPYCSAYTESENGPTFSCYWYFRLHTVQLLFEGGNLIRFRDNNDLEYAYNVVNYVILTQEVVVSAAP